MASRWFYRSQWFHRKNRDPVLPFRQLRPRRKGKTAGGTGWQKRMRFCSSVSEEDVQPWLSELG